MRTAPVHSVALGLLLAAAAPIWAQTAQTAQQPAPAPSQTKAVKATPPAPAPAKDVRFPAFTEKTLANGLRVVVIEQHEQPAVSLRLVVPAGRAFDPAGKAGLAEATASLLDKGAGGRNAQQIAAAIDGVGGALGANAGLESAYATARVTTDQLDLGLDLLADILLRPTFPAEEVERGRSQALSGLQITQEDAAYLAGTALARLVYGAHPYGQPVSGTPESLRGLTREDIVAFHRRHYGPDQALLAVVGDVKTADVLPQIERRFGAWAKAGTPAVPPVPASLTKPERDGHLVVVLDKPDAVQTEIRIGQVALPFRDPDLYAAEVYNSVVGGSSSARLFQEVRRKRGLAYGAYSSFADTSQPGLFEVATSTKTESTVEALEVALGVLREVQEKPVPAAELESAKSYITGAFPLEIETPDGIADKVLEAMKFGYGKEFLETYNERVAAVSAADLQRFAKARTAPGRTVLVLVGNAAAFGDALKAKFGDKVTVLPYREADFLRPGLRKAAAAAVPEADGARARELLAQARQAMGGKAFAEQRSQIARGSGSMTPPGMPQPMAIPAVVIYEVYPDKSRTELDLPVGKMVQAVDGGTAWAGMGAQLQDLPAAAADQRFFGVDLLRRFDAAGMTARPLPDAEVDGKPARVVELADAQGHATRFFLDPATNRVTKVAFELAGTASETQFADYREVDGVQVAFKSTTSQNGAPLFALELKEVQVNPAVDAALFKKPAP
jgi:zinc protease